MKIKLSKSQWVKMGKKDRWIKMAQGETIEIGGKWHNEYKKRRS